MVFADWTVISQYAALDATTKYAGNSSVRLYCTSGTQDIELEHDTFLEAQCQVVFWLRTNYRFTGISYGINFTPFGYANIYSYGAGNTWEKWRATFWYDIASNTKWSRIELWGGSNWVQQGSDYNWGSGSPTAGKLRLKTTQLQNQSTWFDEVEVYS